MFVSEDQRRRYGQGEHEGAEWPVTQSAATGAGGAEMRRGAELEGLAARLRSLADMEGVGQTRCGAAQAGPLNLSVRLRRIVRHLARPRALPRLVWKNLTWPFSPVAAELRSDRSLGIDTAGIIAPEQLDFAPERQRSATPYQASPARITRHVIRQVASRLPGARFIDIGAGKGRVLIIASECPFSEVIGVELSPQLCALAAENIARRGHRRTMAPITLLNMDATEFQIPPGPCVFFFFTPFHGLVLREIANNIAQSLEREPRKAIIIYCGVEDTKGKFESLHGDVFDRSIFDFEQVHDLPRDRSARPGFAVAIFESKLSDVKRPAAPCAAGAKP